MNSPDTDWENPRVSRELLKQPRRAYRIEAACDLIKIRIIAAMNRSISVAAGVLLSLATSVAAAADSYPITLSSPNKPGDKLAVSRTVKVKLSQKWTDPGNERKPTDEQFEASMNWTQTVNAFSDKGRPTALSVVVTRCTKDKVELLKPGTAPRRGASPSTAL